MSATIQISSSGNTESLYDVVGHVLVAVVHGKDGSLAIERFVGVNIEDFPEDGATVTAFIQDIEKKLNEALPEPEPVPQIWIPE